MKETQKLIKKLDTVFSQYIRLKYADNNGMVKCYTCGRYHHWKEMDAGHYISRRHYGTRWEERNVRPQCTACNIYNQGSADSFCRNLIKEYGVEVLDLLAVKKNNIFKLNSFTLNLLITEYKEKLKQIK